MNRRHFFGLTASTLAALSFDQSARPVTAATDLDGGFFFRNNDRVVMIGDSITEQHLHSNYVEIFTVSRFPNWHFAFRNAGIGGDTSAGGNSRTQRDVLSFHPTAVTITFGMNDAGYRYPYDPARLDAYRKGLQGMLDQLKGVRVAVLSSSPVEKKEDGKALEGYNQTLETFAYNARWVALKNGASFVDQFHPHLAALQKARDESPSNRINGGDAVHPGPPGQLLMAWAILKGLHAPSLVSSARVDAGRGRASDERNCSVHDVRSGKNHVRFVREDRALPYWIQPEARPILKWAPIVEDLDQFLLTVNGLPNGSYELRIDGKKAANVTAAELSAGYNLALLTDGPIAAQSRAVHDAVFAKNRYYHDQIFRGVTLNPQVPAEQKASLAEERMKKMPELEKAIRDALVVKPHEWEIVPA